MEYFFLVSVFSNWSPLSNILHISQLEWSQILPASLSINYLNLEPTTLSLIVFGFRKATLGGDVRALWSLGDFSTCLGALRRIWYNWFSAGWYVRTSVTLSSIFLSRIWNETVLFTNFTISISESTWSSLYPCFNDHCFNSFRHFSFSSIEQIILNLMTCPYAIDLLYTLRWHNCAWRSWSISFCWQYKSVSNLLPTFVTVTPKMFISVVE